MHSYAVEDEYTWQLEKAKDERRSALGLVEDEVSSPTLVGGMQVYFTGKSKAKRASQLGWVECRSTSPGSRRPSELPNSGRRKVKFEVVSAEVRSDEW